MLSEDKIRTQLNYVLEGTDFSFLGRFYGGKVRDSYSSGALRYLITTDRLSCFDRIVTCVPFKGEILTRLALHWFELTKDIVPNHVISNPDPNVMVVRECQIIPIEVVVRGYLAGSAWRDYEAGKDISGVKLPAGLTAHEKLPQVIVTPSTKAEIGTHDQPISEAQIIEKSIMSRGNWERVREAALKLFSLGQQAAEKRGLILVDTKYEFGMVDGELLLADEIHTLDSSRYWIAASYQDRLGAGLAPEMLDKEPTRQWLLSQGFKGDGEIPVFTAEHRIEISKHYMSSYELITGIEFTSEVGPVKGRIETVLRSLTDS